MSNIIDIRGRIKKSETPNQISESNATVMDITQIREAAIHDDRRSVKRTILTQFISVHTIVPGCGLMKVALYDIHDNGLAFDIEEGKGQFHAGEEISMRVYLNHQTYFPFSIKVKHINYIAEEGVFRHGSEFMKETLNDVALYHFVKFIETVSASLKHDRGDVLVSNINS